MNVSERKKKVAVVVPFLNEEENLPVLYGRLTGALANEPEDLEMVFVDDGSTDGSAPWVTRTIAEDPRVKMLRLSRNFGHQIAITAGLDAADGDAVVVIDADLQDPPEAIRDLLAKWREGYEVVYAVRERREGETWHKKLLASMFYRVFCRLAGIQVPMNAGDFRLLDRKVVDALKDVRELHRFMRGLTSWAGFSQCAVNYARAARHAGETKYPVWKSARLALDAVTSFSGTPLRWMMVVGLFFATIGFLDFLAIFIQWARSPGSYQPGWTSVVAWVILLGGIQLLSLGVVGQYVSRIFEESKKRPLYIVRERVGAFEPGG